jgi:hypothetical protein
LPLRVATDVDAAAVAAMPAWLPDNIGPAAERSTIERGIFISSSLWRQLSELLRPAMLTASTITTPRASEEAIKVKDATHSNASAVDSSHLLNKGL